MQRWTATCGAARVARRPAVDAQVAEAELRREELARRDPVDAPALVARDRALAFAVGRCKRVRRWRRAGLREPRAALLELRLVLLDHPEQVVLNNLPKALVHWAVLPREVFADEALTQPASAPMPVPSLTPEPWPMYVSFSEPAVIEEMSIAYFSSESAATTSFLVEHHHRGCGSTVERRIRCRSQRRGGGTTLVR